MTKKAPFSDLAKKKKTTPSKEAFIDSAKVDGQTDDLPPKTPAEMFDKNARRGSGYIDKETGKRVKLGGKVLQVPVNEYELYYLELGAQKMGLTVASYLRTIGINTAKRKK